MIWSYDLWNYGNSHKSHFAPILLELMALDGSARARNLINLGCPIDQTVRVINPQSGPSTITNCAAHSENNKQYLVRIFTDTFFNLQWI